MATEPSKKKAVKKAATKKAAVKKAAVKKAAKKKAAAKKATMSYQQRYEMIAEAAYHIAEKQDFAPGHEVDHWLEAEQQIDSWIKKQKIKLSD